MFLTLKDHLSDDGIIQLLYYYNTWLINSNSDYNDYFDGYNLDKLLDVLDIDDDDYKYIEFDNTYGDKDGVVLYKKR